MVEKNKSQYEMFSKANLYLINFSVLLCIICVEIIETLT